jgi:hypothetical protein
MGRGMGDKREEAADIVESFDVPMNARQLRAYQHGVGVRIMPARDGWKIDFFGLEDFEAEQGQTYATLEAALRVAREWLPRVNTKEEREKAKVLEELLWRQLESNTLETLE